MAVEHIVAFVGRLVADTMLLGRMVGCRIAIAQVDCFIQVYTHSVGEIVAAKRVVDRMMSCFEMVDFG